MDDSSSRTIRVLHLCEHFGNRSASFHGVARSFELWIPHLDQPPFRVLLCSRATPNEAALKRFRKKNIAPLHLGYHKLDPRNLFKLIGILRREKIDILHLHGYGACTWGRIAGHLLGIPAIVHERCNYVTVPWFQRPVEFVLGPFTKYAFAVSESTRVFTVKKRFIPDRVVKTLYSGIQLEAIPPADAEASRAARASHGVGENDFLLGVVSRLEPHKGHRDLLRALAAIRKKAPDVKLWIIGDGYDQEPLEAFAREQGVGDAVAFLGYQADVWPLIRALDVQVFPSHQEGTPNTLYEAMAVGNCILASTADGQGEVLTHDRDALMHEPGDVDTLVRNFERIHGDPEQRARLAAAASERVKDFDMMKTLDTLKQTYRAIAG